MHYTMMYISQCNIALCRIAHTLCIPEDRYVELLNFDMEVMSILETRVYELTDEEKVSVIIHWLGQEGL